MVLPEKECVLGSRIFTYLAHSYEFAVTLFIGKLISLFFVTATFVVYMMTPRLMNLRGSMLCGYLTSYIGGMFMLSCFLASIKYLDDNRSCSLLVVIVSGLWYFVIASMCWLNVMCFDSWKKVGMFRSDQDLEVNENPESNYNDYSKYAWGGPTFWILLSVGFTLASNSNDTSKFQFLTTMAVLPAAMITICNTSIFILTEILIKKRENKTEEQLDHVDLLHQENEQWFSSCVQLFLLMKIPLILLAAGIYWQNLAVFTFGSALEALQGYLIFKIFVFKKMQHHDSAHGGRNERIPEDGTAKSVVLSNNSKRNDNLVEKKVERKKRLRTIIRTVEKKIRQKLLRNR